VTTPLAQLRRAISALLIGCCLTAPGLAQEPVPEVRDPVYGEMLFDFYSQDYFKGLVRTLVEIRRQDQPLDLFGGRLPAQRDDAQCRSVTSKKKKEKRRRRRPA